MTATVTEDPTITALDRLADVLEQNAADERLLAERIRQLKEVRATGTPWRQILTDEAEPGMIALLSTTLARLSLASGTVRRSLVVALRQEGVTIPVIARLFGVTHQRVSNLLRRLPKEQ